MLEKIFIRSFILFCMVSCVITPPNLASKEGEDLLKLRSVDMVCSDLTLCETEKVNTLNSIAFYSIDPCNEIDDETLIVGESVEQIKCKDGKCEAKHTRYFINGEESLALEGLYTFFVFIDLNSNDVIDYFEPFYCTEEVEINMTKKNNRLVVEVIREFE